MNIHFHIEKLILDGLPVEQRHGPLLQAAVEAELTRLLAEMGLDSGLHSAGALQSLPASSRLQISSDTNPVQIGNQIAQSVYSILGSPAPAGGNTGSGEKND